MIMVEHRKNLFACFKRWMTPFDRFSCFRQNHANFAQLFQQPRFEAVPRRSDRVDQPADGLAFTPSALLSMSLFRSRNHQPSMIRARDKGKDQVTDKKLLFAPRRLSC